MFTVIIMLFGHFMTIYRLCKVFRKGYTTICEVYAKDMREPLRVAVDDPAKEWDDKLMEYMDKAFNYKG